MISKVQNTNFGKINIVVSRKAYDAKPIAELEKIGKSVADPWTTAQTIFSEDEAFTDAAQVCTAGILKPKGGKEFAIFHYSPFTNTFYEIREQLKEIQGRFKDAGAEQLEGFLIGANNNNGQSMCNARDIARYFTKNKIDFAALIGQKWFPWANLHFSLPKNEATVTFCDCESIKQFTDLKKSFKRIVEGSHTIELTGE